MIETNKKKYLWVIEIKKWNFEKDKPYNWLPSYYVYFNREEARKIAKELNTPEMTRVRKYKK